MSETNKRERDIFIKFSEDGDTVERLGCGPYDRNERYVHYADYVELLGQLARLSVEMLSRDVEFRAINAVIQDAIKSLETKE